MKKKSTRKLKTGQVRERKKIGRLVLFSLLGLISFVGLVYAAHADALQITSIVLLGETSVDEAVIEEKVSELLASSYLGLFPKSNAIIYPRNTIEQTLIEEIPKAESVHVELSSFHEVAVTVTDRKPVFVWCGETRGKEESCFLGDAEGYLYAPPLETLRGDLILRAYGPLRTDSSPQKNFYLSEENFDSLRELLFALREGGFQPKEVRADLRGGEVEMDAGWQIKFLFSTPKENLLSHLKGVLESPALKDVKTGERDLEYIDLRFGNKVFYRFK